jgi:hypothetical protein
MILRPDGGIATKKMLAMSDRQVSWFIDPEAFLRHLADLGSIKVAAFCRHCYERGLPEDVSATFDANTRAWTVRCACADYPPIKDKGRAGLAMDKPNDDGTTDVVKVFTTDELLFRLGWSFKCTDRCATLGMADGVQGENDPRGHVLKVTCGCMERTYREPQAN